MIKQKIWQNVSKKVFKNGVKVTKIDGDLIEDIIELRDEKYLDSVKRARMDAAAGRIYNVGGSEYIVCSSQNYRKGKI